MPGGVLDTDHWLAELAVLDFGKGILDDGISCTEDILGGSQNGVQTLAICVIFKKQCTIP